jgi:hypothetical protein
MKGEYLSGVYFATAIFCSEVSEWGTSKICQLPSDHPSAFAHASAQCVCALSVNRLSSPRDCLLPSRRISPRRLRHDVPPSVTH